MNFIQLFDAKKVILPPEAALTKAEKASLTKEEQARYVELIDWGGYPKQQALEMLTQSRRDARRNRLKAEAERLSKLDPTENEDMCDSAHINACDTCREQGVPSMDKYGNETLEYYDYYVCTLRMILDDARIAH